MKNLCTVEELEIVEIEIIHNIYNLICLFLI